MANKAITSRDVDFAKWYTDICLTAHLASYSNVKGCIVIEPNGYAIWENIKNILDKKFKELGHRNLYMPLLIPENLMKKESDLIEGFAPEVAWVTIGGEKKLDERLCIRPTSETLFSDYYSTIVKSYRDLPVLYNQWCNVLRWEKETRPFLRSREFLWQEGHTVHETKEEAEFEAKQILDVYYDLFQNYLAIPCIEGKKTDKEKFAGAEYTYTIESLMYNGVCLQSATSHYFGQRFSKAYDIKFLNRENKLEHAYQTSWGSSTRMIGGVIMVHSDDLGLVLPPKIAPIKVVIIPIGTSNQVEALTNNIESELSQNNITTYVDRSEKSPGFKFAEAETNGIPIRIEIGERDLKENMITIVRRDTLEKIKTDINTNILDFITNLLEDIQINLYNKAKERRDALTYTATTLEEMKNIIETKPGFIKAMWCGSEECENKIKETNGIKSRCIPFEEEQEHISDTCVCCNKPAKEMVIWGIQY